MSSRPDSSGSLRRVPLQGVATVIMGQSPPSSAYNVEGNGLPFFQGKAEFGPIHPTPVKWCSEPTKTAEPDDVLMSVRAPVGPTNLAIERCCIGRGLAAIRALPGVRSKWLLYAFRAMERAIDDLGTGSTFKAISGETLRQLEVPIADLDHQDRAIAEIERQFSRLDKGVESLKRVKANLKRYESAVLMSAVEGRIVPNEAEIAHLEGRRYETGEQLLERILQDRYASWIGKGKYKEPSAPDLHGVPKAPEGWAYATAEQLTDENRAITYGVIKLGEPAADGVPVLRSSDVRRLHIELGSVKRISPEIAGNYRRTYLSGGEVVLTVRGTLGGIAVVPSQCRGFNISREVAMLALVEPKMAQLVAFFVASPPIRSWLLRRTKGIAYTGINIETLKALPIPIPPAREQSRIVAEIERRLSIVRELEAEVDRNLARAKALRSAVLTSAFGAQ